MVDYEISCQFKAKEIPKSTMEPRYQKIMEANEKRREDVIRQSQAMTRANEKPFSFYHRDVENYERKKNHVPDLEVMEDCGKFKANPVPWYCKAHLFKRMVENDAQERELRIKDYAELSYSLSKLPPRMALYEEMKRQGLIKQKSMDDFNLECTFKPRPARDVPDFEKLQHNFQHALEKQRRSRSVTQPQPFNFCPSKKDVDLHYHMDVANHADEKLMTFQTRRYKNEIEALKKPAVNPPSTLKQEAAKEKRRQELEFKLY